VADVAIQLRCVVAVALAVGCRLTAAGDAPAAPPLTTVAQIRALSTEQAQRRLSVQLRGVITYTRHATTTDFTLQDATGGVWLPATELPANCQVGAEVEITGCTEPGVFSPIVRATTVRALGVAALPPATPVSYEELLAARFHSQRVELTGIIRSQRINPDMGLNWLALELASGGGRVTVNVTHEIVGHPELVDARIRVCGVCLHSPDPREQQVFLPTVNIHSLDDIAILRPGAAQPSNLPITPLDQLLRTTGQREPGHLVHVRGTVTLVPPDGPLALQDATRGLRVWLREASRPQPGEEIDVAGFPEPGGYAPILRDAIWQLVGPASPPAPLAVEPQDAPRHDGRLLNVRGRLATALRGEDKWTLTLEHGPQRFLARIYSTEPLPWRIGSELAVRGVCEAEVGSWEAFVTHRKPQGFILLARDFAAVTLLAAPSWWTTVRVLAVAAGILAVALGALWLRAWRRLREERLARAEARAQFAAVFTERNRMAREIHDTLAQGFAGISVQLEALGDRLGEVPDAARHHLDLARQLVRESLAEARRTVWALRAQALEEGSLGTALERLGRQLTEGSAIAFEFRPSGTPRALPAQTENDLLRIGQEALTNAVRHAQARKITLALEYQEDAVRLAVSDDGCGLNDTSPGGDGGGFGLPGMRARANALHAELQVRSAPDAGTTIELTVSHV
jgi:signal transduction histidine kinase